ncbi:MULTISPECIES: hypothetical protein [unclassified Paenibacillus]|uniref:hypothetical protein n=1 Tax=unclassified Paenibacillus TaxID=185978 RepID=UPI00089647BD|nr:MULTISPECIES: hypothetical protein [unclassified Paenibacillus]OMC71249.1 hypothetical protein BK126_03860 [Paenibacillus sp. FSL H7-0326]SDW21022.1 hypothetical protein SAMN05518848_101659 [Paenibacillus sp. PDC88]
MKHDHSSLQSFTTVAQASNSVKKLHHAVSQAMSHPTPDMLDQANKRLLRAENAVAVARQQLNYSGTEFAEEILSEEKERLTSLHASLASKKPEDN